MANISVTYSFSNSTTADATQVNQNYTDIINGTSDGTKDMSISALTVAGIATLNGNVTLGNATGDDITISGSIAASIPVKTNNSFDFGAATLALASVYLGAPSSRSTRITAHQSLGASNTLVLPNGNGTVDYVARTDGSGNLSFVPQYASPTSIRNLSYSTSVSGSALTITFAGGDGTALSATNPAFVNFRSSTATVATTVTRKITANFTVVVSSGSTLGHASGVASFIHVYLIDNAGTVEAAVRTTFLGWSGIVTTTAEGAGGAADSNAVMYSTTARTSVAYLCIGRCTSNQTVAGTWDANVTAATGLPFQPEPVVAVYASNAAVQTLSTSAIVNYEDKIIDNYNCVTTGAGLWNFTAPKAGYYLIRAGIKTQSVAWNAGNSLNMVLSNASTYRLGDFYLADAETMQLQIGGSVLLSMAAAAAVSVNVASSQGVLMTASQDDNYVAITEIPFQ